MGDTTRGRPWSRAAARSSAGSHPAPQSHGGSRRTRRATRTHSSSREGTALNMIQRQLGRRQPRRHVDLPSGDRPGGDHHRRARAAGADEVRQRQAAALIENPATTSGSTTRARPRGRPRWSGSPGLYCRSGHRAAPAGERAHRAQRRTVLHRAGQRPAIRRLGDHADRARTGRRRALPAVPRRLSGPPPTPDRAELTRRGRRAAHGRSSDAAVASADADETPGADKTERRTAARTRNYI
jgi:hypothetical protein